MHNFHVSQKLWHHKVQKTFFRSILSSFHFWKLDKIADLLGVLYCMLLTSLERNESCSLYLSPPCGPDLMFINPNINHALSTNCLISLKGKVSDHVDYVTGAQSLRTHFKWQNISIHHQSVNFTHFLLKMAHFGHNILKNMWKSDKYE